MPPPPAYLEVLAPFAPASLAEPVIGYSAAAARVRHGAKLTQGPLHRSLVLSVPGLFFGLVQPRQRNSEAANLATHQVKADLDAVMDTTTGFDQGIVFLPSYVKVLRSGWGADENARRRLSYHVDRFDAPGDLLDHALLLLQQWQEQDRTQEQRLASYGDALRRHWQSLGSQ